MADKNFVVKNGLVVNNTLIVAASDTNRVGINIAVPDSTLTVNGTANVVGAAKFNSTTTISGTLVVSGGLQANGSLGTAGQILQSNGSSIFWGTGASSGVTNIATGNGLSGGPITTTGTLSVVGGNGIDVSGLGVAVKAANGLIANSSGLFVNANTGLIANSSGLFFDTSSAPSVDNADRLDGQHGEFYTNASNMSTGILPAARLNGTYTINIIGNVQGSISNADLATKASTLAQGGGTGAGMTFYFTQQTTQPSFLWGTADGTGTGHYVYYPSSLSVNNSVHVNNKTESNLNVNNSVYLNGKSEASLSVNNSVYLNGKTEGNLNVNSSSFSANSGRLNGKLESGLNVNSASSATNSSQLGGVSANGYAKLAGGSTFTGDVVLSSGNDLDALGGYIKAQTTVPGNHAIQGYSSTTAHGVFGQSLGSGFYGVYGTHASSGYYGGLGTSSYGLFVGNGPTSLQSLSKTSGTFKIDHPLPSMANTHYLVHSFVEAPTADNIYRGKVKLVNGTATVNLDISAGMGMTNGTFTALNGNVQYFLQNDTGWSPVKGNVVGNILNIFCQDTTSTDTISWLVIGTRQDKTMIDVHFTDDYGQVIVEKLKSSEPPIPQNIQPS